MIDSGFNNIVQILSRHFEMIMVINFAIFGYYIFIFVLVKMTDRSIRGYIRNSLKDAVYGSVFAVQMFLMMLTAYLYWANYHKPVEYLHIPGSITQNALWVKSNQKIYFIDGNDLLATQANGRNSAYIYEGTQPLREYHFSPDGNYILVVTGVELILVDLNTLENIVIDQLGARADQKMLKGVIDGVRWSKDSHAFYYEISRWSPYSAIDSMYIYFLKGREKRLIESPARRISQVYWDNSSENLFYLRYEMGDHATIHQLKVVKIPIDTLRPKIEFEIPYDSKVFPKDALELRGINLFMQVDILSYGGQGERTQLIADNGRRVGIDDEDNFYIINEKWFKRRLFKVRRKSKNVDEEFKRYQYKGGDLALNNIRWLPGGQYVIMEHYDLGILILDPLKLKIGQLVFKQGRNFGWHLNVNDFKILEEDTDGTLGQEGRVKNRSLSFIPR